MPNKSTVKSKTGRWEWPGNEAILVYSIWCTPSLRWGSPTVTQDSEEKQVEELRYTVKVINAGTSSGCVIKKWDTNTRFSNVSDLKDQLASDFATLLQDGADFLVWVHSLWPWYEGQTIFYHRRRRHSKYI